MRRRLRAGDTPVTALECPESLPGQRAARAPPRPTAGRQPSGRSRRTGQAGLPRPAGSGTGSSVWAPANSSVAYVELLSSTPIPGTDRRQRSASSAQRCICSAGLRGASTSASLSASGEPGGAGPPVGLARCLPADRAEGSVRARGPVHRRSDARARPAPVAAASPRATNVRPPADPACSHGCASRRARCRSPRRLLTRVYHRPGLVSLTS
jgi:hypothetical protein